MNIHAEIKKYEQVGEGYKIEYEYDTETKTAKLTDGNNIAVTKVDFILPSFKVEGDDNSYQVKSIGENAFRTKNGNNYIGNTNIEYVIIPKGITLIEANAFNGCSNLKLLELPETMITVATNAFSGCGQLTYVCCKNPKANLAIPSSLPNNELMALFVPNGSAHSGEYGYLNPEYKWVEGNRFKGRIFEGNMKTFYSKEQNRTYVCADGAGKQAILIEGNRASDITIDNYVYDGSVKYNVVGIGRGAFYGFSELLTLKIAEGITTISNTAFQRCSNLSKLELPSTLNAIGTNAFGDCNNLKHVWCKVADPTILDATRFPDRGMMTLYVPNAEDYKESGKWKEQFHNRIFAGELKSVSDGDGREYVYSKEANIAILYKGNKDRNIKIPPTIEEGIPVIGIDRGAFSGFNEIKKVIIPSSVTAIGSSAFANCNNLSIVHIQNSTPFVIDNNVFSTKSKATLFVPTGSLSSYTNTDGWKFYDMHDCEAIEEFSDDGMDYVGWTIGGQKYAKLTKGKSGITRISTPANSYKVVAIGESAFSGIRSIEDLTIQEEITKIEANAFKNCSDIKSIKLPSSLSTIGANAFQNCTNLNLLTLPENITTIGDKAFNGCSNLVEVVSKGLVPVTDATFPDNGIILYIPSGKTELDYKIQGWNFSHAFYGYRVFESQSDLTYVYGDADSGDRKEAILVASTIPSETVEIPATIPGTDKKVIAVAKNAFMNNSTMKNLIIPEGVKSIEPYAFRNCSKLNTIVLPSTLTTIRNYAFAQCSNITKITSRIPGKNLFALEENVFPSMTPTIFVPNGSKSYYIAKEGWNKIDKDSYKEGEATPNVKPDGIDYMFYDCYSGDKTATLTKIISSGTVDKVIVKPTIEVNGETYHVTAIGSSLFDGTAENRAKITTLEILEGIKTIGANAFKDWKGLTTVTLPDGLTSIGPSAFQGCNHADFKLLNIPNSVETIGSYAFQGCSNLKNVTLSEKLTSIENNVFANITALEKIVIPDSVKSIGAYAFAGCTRLNIELPNNLKSIGDNAFENNTATVSLIIPEKVESIGLAAFKGCTKLATITSKIKESDLFAIDIDVFPESVRNAATLFVPIDEESEEEGENEPTDEPDSEKKSRTIAKYSTTEGWKEFREHMIEGEKLQYEDDDTKMVYEYLTGPHTATLIGTHTEKSDVVLEHNFTIITEKGNEVYKVEAIGESAFSAEKNPNTKNIKSLILREGISSIGANAFKGCSNLTRIELPSTLKTIGTNAFNGCTSLVNVNLQVPSVLETIAANAFQGCSSLKKIELPSSLTSIGASAFQSSGLQKIWLRSSLKEIGDNAFNYCNSLSNVGVEHDVPLAISANVFSFGTGNKATLFVPEGKKAAYDIEGWNKFSNVVEGEFVDVYTDDDKKMTFSCFRTKGNENNPVLEAIITNSTTYDKHVKIDEYYKEYQVRAIGKYAFNTCTNIGVLELPSSLLFIGESAFGGCAAIREIISDIDKDQLFPITDEETNSVFHADVKHYATLYVPIKSKETYKATRGWKSFTHDNIIEGKWLKTTDADANHLKYRYHTGKEIATVMEVVFPADQTEELLIPSAVTIGEVTYDVDSIAISKFTNKDKVKKLVIHDAAEGMEGIKTIEANSFSGCTNLATVFLPSSLEVIGEKAFDGCPNIANLNIQHASASDINANVFSISEGNKAALFVKKGTAGSYDKDGWNKFSNIVEGEFIDTYIGSVGDEKDITFSLYTTTDAEEHPVNAAIITKAATNTQLVTIPASITREGTEYLIKNIGSYAFSTSKNLNNLKIATNVETIGKSAFTSCTDLNTLELPSSLRAIKSDAFGACKSLVEIVSYVDKDNLFTIDNDVFHVDAKAKAKLYVPEGESKKAYESTDFWSSFEHKNIIDGHWKQTSTPDNYYLKYKYLKSSRDAEVIEIDFPDEENVTKLEIPSSVEIEGVKYYVNKIIPADFIHKDKVQTLIIQNKDWDEDEIAGKNGIELISANTFQGCTNLQKIWLPKSLKSIGSKAFDGCNPTRICIEALPTIEKSDAFSGSVYNNALLFVPTGSLATIGNQARWRDFSWKYEGYYEDESTEGLDRTYIYLKQADDSRTAILTKSKKSETIDTSISLGENTYRVTIIGKNAFSSGVDLGEWTSLPEGIVAIEKDAFRSTKLKEIKLPSTLKSIGDNAFRYNDLTSISIPNGVTIGQYAFANCKLAEVTLPNDLTKIEKGAFRENTNLKSLTIPESVNTIGDEALMGCTGLTKIVLPSSLTAIASNAFDGCSNLTEVISKLENTNDIDGISLSVPTAILYVKEGTIDHYSNWSCLYVLEGDRAIGAADGLEYAYTSSEKSGNNAILIGVTEGGINEDGLVTIPDSVTIDNLKYKVVAIGKDVFKDNTNLKKLEIRANLSSIGVNAFEGCSNLAEVICDEYDEKLNVLSQLDPLLYVPSDEIKKKYVNAGWKSDRVYVGKRQEKELGGLVYAYTIADAESSIREAVLVGATAEAISENGAVTIPGSIKFKVDEKDEAETEFNVISIVNSVFSGNTKVKLLTIGEHVKSIGEHAFDGCTNLKEVVSKITDENVIGSISFSQPGVVLYVPEAALVDAYKAWNFTYTLVGERKVWNKDGLYYLCATGDKKAILVEGKAAEMRGDELTITGSIAFKVDEKDEAETTFDVIAIADEAFKGNTDIKNLKIEESIETIGASAFQGCLGLNKIWLPASLVCLKDMAFYGCSNMAYIGNVSATPLATVGANVFPKTTSTLYVPFGSKEAYTESSVWGAFSKVKEGTFVEAVNLNGLTFECIVNDKNEKVTQLVKAASSLTEVIIPSEVQDGDATYRVAGIEDRAFEACTKLTVITSKISKENLFEFKKNVFPEAIYENATVYAPYDTDGSTEKKYKETEGWKYFATYAKGEKKAAPVGDLTYEYIIGVGTATITKAATNISKVSIDGTVTIDGAAYTVKAIGANAFKGCNGLKVVWLPATLEAIDKTAFSGCNNIAYVSSAIDSPAAADANIFPSTATLFVPQGRKAYYNIGGWNNFVYVAEGAFVDVATASDMSFDCYTDNAGKKKAILRKYNANAAAVEIPQSVNSYTVSIITKQAFAGKSNMESLVIPSDVETIEAEAFSACSKLKWIESKIVNPISANNVFANSNATLFIPSNNVSVSDYKARGWNFLNVFVGERKQTDVDGWTYVYSTGDKKAVLTRVGNVGTNVTINGTFKIGKDEYTVTSVGDAVFKGKSNIEALTIAKSIENIGANAFEGCVKLVSITCEGSSPAKLGADAFPSANVTVNVPNDAVNTYKNHPDWKPFANNILGITTSVEDDPTGAYNIIVPAGGDATPEVEIWSGLDASGDVVIPEVVELNGSDYKVTGIAANAYDSNTDLTSIVIPSSITSIGASAFAGCTNLKSITVYCVTPINLSAIAATRRALTRAGGSSSVFEGVNKETCILYVPAESIDAYKQAEGWKDFKKIYAISATAINGIVISEGKPFDVYNLQGRKVKTNTTTFSGLPAGVYIVNGKKVMVK